MPFNHNGIVMVNLEGEITYANSIFCDHMGTTLNQVLGISCFQFVFPRDLEIAKKLLEANKLPNPKPFAFQLQHTDHSPVSVNIQGTPLTTPAGDVYGVLATIIFLNKSVSPQSSAV